MKIEISYITRKTRLVKSKTFIKTSVKEALQFFEWRYGHIVTDVKVL